ncbi:hypothetical protein F9L07_11705 [Pimelobacter simplex]|uniref:Uncharacterized protein n=1 Tax=Nocardioides simplex TaxID=2045 RepID=A0A7J5E2C6_NOCSI|nr:hypothetical protein [Pimelobacter simplex]KAB2812430.1 hypothetical protein F9L07_11705 [Pimelobacter simplex]
MTRRHPLAPAVSASAFAGFVDVALCCLLLLRLDPVPSVLWGVAGAMAASALTLLLRGLGSGGTGDADDGVAERLAAIEESFDDNVPEGDPDPWWQRVAWNAVIVLGAAGAGALALALAFSRTLLTILILAYAARPVSPWLVVALFALSVTLQLLGALVVGRWGRKAAGPSVERRTGPA